MSNAIEGAPFFRWRVLITLLALSCLIGGPLPSLATAEQHEETSGQSTKTKFVEPLTEPLAVIPPGQEELLAEMLGRGAPLPGQCTFANGQVENDRVTATYTCAAGDVVITLRHPTKAASDATLTEQFAISVQSGSPPAELKEELASRIRSREGEFEWTWLGLPEGGQSSRWAAVLIAILLAVGLLWLALRRGRQHSKDS